MSDRVLIYGSRDWWDQNAVRDVVMALPEDAVVIHGGASGADRLVGKWAKARGLRVEVFRADWQKHGKAAGPIRNQQMIDQGHPTRAYGFRLGEVSKGTDDMTGRLVKAGIPVEIIHDTTAAARAPEGEGEGRE